MRMLRAGSADPSSQDQPSNNKSRRRFRGKRSDLSSEQTITNAEPNMLPMNNSRHLSHHQLPQDMSAFQGSISPRPGLELDQLNQRQLLLHALVASSTGNSNIHQRQHSSPRGQTPSPVPSLSSSASSSHASSFDTFREPVTGNFAT